MRKKALITVLLVMVLGAVASLKAQQYEYVAFNQQTSGGNSESRITGNLTQFSYPYFSSAAVVEFALEATGNIYPIPNIYLSVNGYKLTYTSPQYGNTVYGTLTVMGQTYNQYGFVIEENSITGTGSVNAKVRILRIVSGNPYARIGSPSELRISASK